MLSMLLFKTKKVSVTILKNIFTFFPVLVMHFALLHPNINMKTIYFTEADDPIDIRYDAVFKAVFTKETPAAKTALSKLVSTLIGRNVSIVEILANELPIENMRDRHLRFDINCRDDNKEPVNVEMSFNPYPYEPVRLEYHMGRLFIGQDIRGQDKTYDDLRYAFQITVLANVKIFPDDNFFHMFEYYDPERRIPLGGRSRIITLELAKLEKVVNVPPTEMSAQEHWAVFFEYLTDAEKRQIINEIIKLEEGIAMASEVLLTISRDAVERARLNSEIKWQLDRQSEIVYAKRQGRAQADEIWQKVVADKDATIADKDAKLADKDAEIARLREQLQNRD